MATKDISDLDVVRAYARWHELPHTDDVWPYTILAERTGQPKKVCFSACERARRRRLIECGVSLRTGWLTDAGLELLRSGQ